jgi:hypothetical protein
MPAIVTPGVLRPDYFREVAAVVGAAAGGPRHRRTAGPEFDKLS